jgi:hypothetical protein
MHILASGSHGLYIRRLYIWHRATIDISNPRFYAAPINVADEHFCKIFVVVGHVGRAVVVGTRDT